MNDTIFTLSNGLLIAVSAMFLAAIWGVSRTFLRNANATFCKNLKTVIPCKSTSYDELMSSILTPPVQQHLKI